MLRESTPGRRKLISRLSLTIQLFLFRFFGNNVLADTTILPEKNVPIKEDIPCNKNVLAENNILT